jgi:hypothetical protein
LSNHIEGALIKKKKLQSGQSELTIESFYMHFSNPDLGGATEISCPYWLVSGTGFLLAWSKYQIVLN